MLNLRASPDWLGLCSGHLPMISSALVGSPNSACSQTCNVGSPNEIFLNLISIVFTPWWSAPGSCRLCSCCRSHSHGQVASRSRGESGRCCWFVGPALLIAHSLSCPPRLPPCLPWLGVDKESRGAAQLLEKARERVTEDDTKLAKLFFSSVQWEK